MRQLRTGRFCCDPILTGNEAGNCAICVEVCENCKLCTILAGDGTTCASAVVAVCIGR
jgi:hypothetical protein